MSITTEESFTCPVCVDYFARRIYLISMWIVIFADRHQVDHSELALAYRGSVHARHLAGGTLSTRIDTPDRKHPGGWILSAVKRHCNGCDKLLGDATVVEHQYRRGQPDVRLECGCYTEDVAA